MALPAEFQRFPNEESFRENFLIPMLHRLGFSVVVNNHGSREFGRDSSSAKSTTLGTSASTASKPSSRTVLDWGRR